jgi:hypothetical protein
MLIKKKIIIKIMDTLKLLKAILIIKLIGPEKSILSDSVKYPLDKSIFSTEKYVTAALINMFINIELVKR